MSRKPLRLDRRRFGQLGAAAIVGGALSPAASLRSLADSHTLVTDIPDNTALIQGLRYVNESARDGQQCRNCLYYQQPGEGRGKCALFANGLVSAAGWCQSWAQGASS